MELHKRYKIKNSEKQILEMGRYEREKNCKRENQDRNHRCDEPPTHDPNKVIPPATLHKARNSGGFYFPVNRRRTVILPN